MQIKFNLRHLERSSLHLQGELAANALDINAIDELISAHQPLLYDIRVERLQKSLLLHGRLSIRLDCECSRCLNPFETEINLPDWTCNLALEGEEKVRVENDCVDLTPIIREDILLAFPQHPLCGTKYCGLPPVPPRGSQAGSNADRTQELGSPWAELNKLKF